MISQDHSVAPHKAITLTAGHDLDHLKSKVKGQYLTTECQSQPECPNGWEKEPLRSSLALTVCES